MSLPYTGIGGAPRPGGNPGYIQIDYALLLEDGLGNGGDEEMKSEGAGLEKEMKERNKKKKDLVP